MKSLLLLVFSLLFINLMSAQYNAEELYGVWQLKKIGGQLIPDMQAAKVSISEGVLVMQVPEGAMDINAEWVFKDDEKTMKITTENGEELWKIDNLTKDELVLFDIKSNRKMFLSKLETIDPFNHKKDEPTDDGSGNYTKIAVPEHLLTGNWSFIKSDKSNLGIEAGDMVIELLENGTVVLSMVGESVEGVWNPADDHQSIEVTVNKNTAKWWLHEFSDKQMKIIDNGILFVFERK